MKTSERLAKTVAGAHSQRHRQIDDLYLRLYSRHPKTHEVEAAMEFLSTDATLQDLCRAMLNSNEFLYFD